MAYIGNDLRSNEDYKIIDDISSGFNGSATSFALQVGGSTPVPFPKFEQQLLISVNGVIQEPDPTGSAGFKLSGTNIVFSSAPTNGHAFFGVIYAGADYVNAGGAFPDGSINFPSITFGADTNTGFTRIASGTVALISDGTKVAQFPTSQGSSGQALVTDGAGVLSFGAVSTATSVTVADESSDTTCFPLFATAATGNLGPKSGSNLTFNSNTGVLTATSFAGDGSNLTGLTTDLVNDTSPQLGGNLDVNTKNILFGDSGGTNDDRLKFGAGGDLEIYHDGSNSFIDDGGTGNLVVRSSTIAFENAPGGGESLAKFIGNGAVELYHDNTKRFETLSSGVKITGLNATGSSVLGDFRFKDQDDNLAVHYDAENNKIQFLDNNKLGIGTGDDLQIYHDGSNSFIDDAGTGGLYIRVAGTGNNGFYKYSSNEPLATFQPDGAVSLYYDNSKKFETTSNGATFLDNVRWNDNKAARFGGGDDLQIYHNGSHSIINNTTGSVQVHDSGTEKFRVSGTGTSFKDDIFIANDNDKINVGAGNDLQISHDGSNSLIADVGTGALVLKSNQIDFIDSTSTEFLARFFENSSVELYFNSSKKFETTSAGVTISGSPTINGTTIANGHIRVRDHTGTEDGQIMLGTGNDFRLYHDASNSYIDNSTGSFFVRGDTIKLRGKSVDEDFIEAFANGEVRLYYDNVQRFSTNSSGAKVHGNSGTIFEASCATNSTASILFSNTEANTSGDMRVLVKTAANQGSDPYIKFDAGGNDMIVGTLYAGGASNKLVLGHGSSPSGGVIGLHIDGNGQIYPDSNNARDLGSSSLRFRNIYTNDLNLSNEGSSNDVDGTWGNYTIQEGAEDLFLINRRNGKKFKFNLMEVA